MSHIARTMYDFHVWANQSMLTHLQKMPKDVYTREIQSAFPTISKGISHIYLVDTCWLSITQPTIGAILQLCCAKWGMPL